MLRKIMGLVSIIWAVNSFAQSTNTVWNPEMQTFVSILREVNMKAAKAFKKSPTVKTLYVTVPTAAGGYLGRVENCAS